MSFKSLGVIAFASIVVLMSAQTALSGQKDKKPQIAPQPKAPGVTSFTPQSKEDDGQQIFQQQCSRCHNTPDGFSSRISGTVARHMRVRASLSKHDEKELMRFLNP